MASYAYQENVEATRVTIELLRDRLDAKEFEKTLTFVDILEGRLAQSSNSANPLPRGAEFDLCRTYDFDAASDEEPQTDSPAPERGGRMGNRI